MKTDLKSIATQLRTFSAPLVMKSTSRNVRPTRSLLPGIYSTPIRDRTAPEISFIYKKGYFVTCLKSFTGISETN